MTIHLVDAGDLDLCDLEPDAGQPLEPCEHLEPPLAPVALPRIGRVGDPLELAQHEAGHDQGAIEEPTPTNVGDPAIDDRRGVEDLVEPAAAPRDREEARRNRRQIGEPPERHGSAGVGTEHDRQGDDGGLAALYQRGRDEAQDQPGPDASESTGEAPEQSLDRERCREDLAEDRDDAGEGAEGAAGRGRRLQRARRRHAGGGRDDEHAKPGDDPGHEG